MDVVYYGRQNQLEFDFVLQPGADPHAIRLNSRGPGISASHPEGDLAFEFGNGRMLQKKPLIYQEDPLTATRREIPGRYVMVARNVVGLRVDGYDRKRPLVIDPTLVYCSYLGGSGTDQINAVQVDSQGHLYVAGSTTTGDLLATNGAYSTTYTGTTGIFVAIIDITPGSGYPVLYLTYIGGGGVGHSAVDGCGLRGKRLPYRDYHLDRFPRSPSMPCKPREPAAWWPPSCWS